VATTHHVMNVRLLAVSCAMSRLLSSGSCSGSCRTGEVGMCGRASDGCVSAPSE
jgi:hypothetical protein